MANKTRKNRTPARGHRSQEQTLTAGATTSGMPSQESNRDDGPRCSSSSATRRNGLHVNAGTRSSQRRERRRSGRNRLVRRSALEQPRAPNGGLDRSVPISREASSPKGCLRILQLNCGRGQAVSAELRDLMVERGYGLLALQEPYTGKKFRSNPPQYWLPLLGTALNNMAAHTVGVQPWTAIVGSQVDSTVVFLAQLSDPMCTVVEVTPPDFPGFYVASIYCRHRGRKRYPHPPPEDNIAL